MADPFESSKLKIARAREHVQDLERRISGFVKNNPYKSVVEADSKSIDKIIHKIKFVKSLPPILTVVVGEAANSLREALDNAGYAVAVASGRIKPRHCAFPFAGSLTEFETNALGRCKDIPQEIVALFARFKPYKGGNDLLWALNGI